MAEPTTLEIVHRWDNTSASTSGAAIEDAAVDTEMEVNTSATTTHQPAAKAPATTQGHANAAATSADVSMLDTTNDLDFSTDGLAARMELILVDLVSRVGGHLTTPVDRRVPLVSLGLDSMSIIQFKGVLDNK